jgi:flagellin
MSTVINTNVPALSAQRALLSTSGQLSTALQRLTSGLRVNSAKDDAAGLAIAERLTTQVRGYQQAIRNAGDGISVAQTAEGGLDSITLSLQRIRELAVQSANFTNTAADRAAIQQEVLQLKNEIDRVANQTAFNGVKLLDGSFTTATFQVGANVGETIVIDSIVDANVVALGKTTFSGVDKFVTDINLDPSNPTGGDGLVLANQTIQIVDSALNEVSGARAKLGATINRFEQTVSNLRITVENQMASRSRIQDADFAQETAALTRAQILQQSGMAILGQANAIPQNVLALLRS